MPIFAAVRCARIKSINELSRIEQHGKREDEASKSRCDPIRSSQNIAVSRYCPDRPLDLVDAFKAMKQETGARERAGAAIGLHMIAVVSPEYIDRSGGRHDPQNPANAQLFMQAQAWAEKEFGKTALIGARMDMDEKGGGVVDLFIVPTVEQKQRQGSRQKAAGEHQTTKVTISTRDALMGIQGRYNAIRSYEALQTSWAHHLQEHLSPEIERGKPKAETQREHVHADIFREAAEAEKQAEKISSVLRSVEIGKMVAAGEMYYEKNPATSKSPYEEEYLLSSGDNTLSQNDIGQAKRDFYDNQTIRAFVKTVQAIYEKSRDIAKELVAEFSKQVEPLRSFQREQSAPMKQKPQEVVKRVPQPTAKNSPEEERGIL